MKNNPRHNIAVEQLRIGLYIHLDLGWMDHPFTFGNFKIKDNTQIAAIKQLGLKTLRYDPLRSDCEPSPPAKITEVTNATRATQTDPPEATQRQRTERQRERLNQLRSAIDESEKRFIAATDSARQATDNFCLQPQEAIRQAKSLVCEMVDSVMTENDIAIQAIGNQSANDHYFHPLNVTVLGLMLTKSLAMTAEEARFLGMAALFHDIGETEVPSEVRTKTTILSREEQAQLEQHSEIGARMARESGLTERVSTIILQHHEHADGSGFPSRLKQDDIDPLARLLAVVNAYDNLCNPTNSMSAMTPYEALAYMFANQRSRFDAGILKMLIKSLGVYPPGSIVQLSSGIYGIVISVNPSKPLRPFIMVHDAREKTDKPLILDLREEPSLNISKCLRPGQLPPEAFKVLNARKPVSYFLDSDLPADIKNP